MIELVNYFRESDKKFFNMRDKIYNAHIRNTRLPKAFEGLNHRRKSFNYHIYLIKRELYDEKDKVLDFFNKNKLIFGSVQTLPKSRLVMIALRERGTFLLRDIIADFFGYLDNLVKLIAIYYKNANGCRRMSKMISALRNHEHSKNLLLTKFIVKEWDNWIYNLYEGYRQDAIHLNPENCEVTHQFKWRRTNESTNAGEAEDSILITLPSKIHKDMGYDKKVDLLEFCLDLQDKMLVFTEEMITLTIKEK